MHKLKKISKNLRLSKSQKGICPLNVYLKRFKVNDKCVIAPNPSLKSYLPSKYYFGKVGTVTKVTKNHFYYLRINNSIIITKAGHIKKA